MSFFALVVRNLCGGPAAACSRPSAWPSASPPSSSSSAWHRASSESWAAGYNASGADLLVGKTTVARPAAYAVPRFATVAELRQAAARRGRRRRPDGVAQHRGRAGGPRLRLGAGVLSLEPSDTARRALATDRRRARRRPRLGRGGHARKVGRRHRPDRRAATTGSAGDSRARRSRRTAPMVMSLRQLQAVTDARGPGQLRRRCG